MAWGRWLERRSLPSEFVRMQQEMDRMFNTAFAPQRSQVFPPVNIYDDGETFHVRAEIPGARKESLDITATGDTLTIRGERVVQSGREASYHRREREAGEFRRSVTLPVDVDTTRVQASYADGILEVKLPRAEAAKPRKVKIESA